MEIELKQGTFKLVNEDKVRRVIEGQTDSRGKKLKGLGKGAEAKEIIVGYDKIGGLIRGKDGAKVKTGCFYDFENQCAFETPKIVYTFIVNGKNVELDSEEEVPMEVKASIKKKK